MQEINTEIYLKKKKIKRENMEEIDIIICLEKTKTKTKRISNIYRATKKLRETFLAFFSFFFIKDGKASIVFQRKWYY